jgi:hypothetical protein
MLLDDAQIGNIVAFDCRERMLTIQVDEMPSGKMPGHRLGARAILVFLPENVQTHTSEEEAWPWDKTGNG